MDVKQKVIVLNQNLIELRNRWKDGSPSMKIVVEQEAKNIKGQIRVFESVLRRRGELPPTEEELNHILSIDKQDKLL